MISILFLVFGTISAAYTVYLREGLKQLRKVISLNDHKIDVSSVPVNKDDLSAFSFTDDIFEPLERNMLTYEVYNTKFSTLPSYLNIAKMKQSIGINLSNVLTWMHSEVCDKVVNLRSNPTQSNNLIVRGIPIKGNTYLIIGNFKASTYQFIMNDNLSVYYDVTLSDLINDEEREIKLCQITTEIIFAVTIALGIIDVLMC